ncbi:MAG: hypothetical protein ACREA9_28990 [Pyrinomonadaceae bacterium]
MRFGTDPAETKPAVEEKKDSLLAMEAEAAQPAQPKIVTAEKKEQPTKTKGKKKPVITPEEEALRLAVARGNAKTIVSTVEGAKKLAAEQILGMDWSGAAISNEEEQELIAILTRFLDSVGWDLSNPKASLAMLVLAELRITIRQYKTLQVQAAEREKAK